MNFLQNQMTLICFIDSMVHVRIEKHFASLLLSVLTNLLHWPEGQVNGLRAMRCWLYLRWSPVKSDATGSAKSKMQGWRPCFLLPLFHSHLSAAHWRHTQHMQRSSAKVQPFPPPLGLLSRLLSQKGGRKGRERQSFLPVGAGWRQETKLWPLHCMHSYQSLGQFLGFVCNRNRNSQPSPPNCKLPQCTFWSCVKLGGYLQCCVLKRDENVICTL